MHESEIWFHLSLNGPLSCGSPVSGRVRHVVWLPQLATFPASMWLLVCVRRAPSFSHDRLKVAFFTPLSQHLLSSWLPLCVAHHSSPLPTNYFLTSSPCAAVLREPASKCGKEETRIKAGIYYVAAVQWNAVMHYEPFHLCPASTNQSVCVSV